MYDHLTIEKKWQQFWQKYKTFATRATNAKKFYVLDMFPYPSGSGLHVGHPEGYTASDIVARYKRLCGFDVLHPIGWDAFGLPAEQYALNTGNHPREFTEQNINNFRTQLQSLGFSYDYALEVNTTDPAYFKWTQWIFVKLYERGLAELRDVDVNWCEGLATVLANEEIITMPDGTLVSERGNFPVVRRAMRQWVLLITKYADRLYNDLDLVAVPDSLKNLQRNWIRNPDGSMHLRDWVFSRQRYWGEPIPIAHDENGKQIVITDLPLELPPMTNIKPSGNGESPLANATEWLHFEQNGHTYRRETSTMPQWAGSSWYYLAYILKNSDGSYEPLNSESAYKRFEKWLPVDLYIGGQEHAVLHLLYARFWHKFLYDLKIVPTPEPFMRIVHQGMILGPDGQKMSKSRGNVISPDEIITKYGADTLRIYEMFMGPLEETKSWDTHAIIGVRRWLERIHRATTEFTNHSKKHLPNNTDKIQVLFNKLIADVTKNIEEGKYNIAISAMMVFTTELVKAIKETPHAVLMQFAVLLSPFAPHMAEEMLLMIGDRQVHEQTWPVHDPKLAINNPIIVAIQINGKLRGTIELTSSVSEEMLFAKVQANEAINKHLLNRDIIRTIYVCDKVLNIVVKEKQ